jgi:hypothetical protein
MRRAGLQKEVHRHYPEHRLERRKRQVARRWMEAGL